LSLQLSDTEFNSPNDLNKVKVYISGNFDPVGEAVFLGNEVSLFINNVFIPKNESIPLEIRADISATGNGQPGKLGNIIKIDWNGDGSEGEYKTYGYNFISKNIIHFTGEDTKSEGVWITDSRQPTDTNNLPYLII